MDVRVSAPAAIAVRPRIAGAYLLLFLIGAETFLISPLLPTITAALQTDVTTAANATTAYVLVYAIASPFLGWAGSERRSQDRASGRTWRTVPPTPSPSAC